MACFLVPMALAAVTSAAQLKSSEKTVKKFKLWLLNALLWGGVVLLAVEHLWHGEVTIWPPFLTAMANPADIPAMLYEMATIGTAMSIAIVGSWGAILAITNLKTKTIVNVPKIAETGHTPKTASKVPQ
ncbi:MAG: hypothetical protein ACTSQY_02255 [Candidatus Odinarchaeia archaeon]